MLNKGLLMVVGGKTEWYTKLTVGSADNHYGYSAEKGLMGIFGSVSKNPSWTFKGTSCSMRAFISYKKNTILYVQSPGTFENYFSEVTVTVVEKNLTVAFRYNSVFGFISQTVLFTPDDVGKTFTIGLDPPPGSYA
jgi:hypothetical protein